MRWRRHEQAPPGAVASENGLLDLAGRTTDLALSDVVRHFRTLVSADMEWTDSRKHRNRRRASAVKVGVLVLTALSTGVLGIKEIPATRHLGRRQSSVDRVSRSRPGARRRTHAARHH